MSVIRLAPQVPNLLVIIFIIIGITIALCILIPIGIKKRPDLVLFCGGSFGIAMLIGMLSEAIFAIFRIKHIKKTHPNLWEITNDRNIPHDERHEALRGIHTLNDPILTKISKRGNRISLFPFMIWLVMTIVIILLSIFTNII